jgi:small subunit ribosomal protein S5
MNRNKKNINRNQKTELENKVIDIRRVARVVAGGRRFNFRVSLVAGDRNGTVGVGIGKSSDTSSAIEKALRNAKKNTIKIPLTKDFSIPYNCEAKYSSAYVIIRKAKKGGGLVAGSSVRIVFDLAGIKNINAKILSKSKNKLNNARAAIKALSKLKV